MKLKNSTILYAISLLTDIAFVMFPFIVTRLFAEQEQSMLQAGMLGAASMLCYGVVTSFSGALSDRFGPRLVIGAGGAAAGVTLFLAIFAGLLPGRAAGRRHRADLSAGHRRADGRALGKAVQRRAAALLPGLEPRDHAGPG